MYTCSILLHYVVFLSWARCPLLLSSFFINSCTSSVSLRGGMTTPTAVSTFGVTIWRWTTCTYDIIWITQLFYSHVMTNLSPVLSLQKIIALNAQCKTAGNFLLRCKLYIIVADLRVPVSTNGCGLSSGELLGSTIWPWQLLHLWHQEMHHHDNRMHWSENPRCTDGLDYECVVCSWSARSWRRVRQRLATPACRESILEASGLLC